MFQAVFIKDLRTHLDEQHTLIQTLLKRIDVLEHRATQLCAQDAEHDDILIGLIAKVDKAITSIENAEDDLDVRG